MAGLSRSTPWIVASGAAFLLAATAVVAQGDPDKYALKEPNGIAFSEVRGYETWVAVGPSYRTDKKEVRVILGNDKAVKAFQEGIPENGKPFPDGVALVKIGWAERPDPAFAPALEPDTLQRVEFMLKDAKRFPGTGGWGYARFVYDAKAKAFKPYGKEASFDNECAECHQQVNQRDFVFTHWAPR
jgi:hypothetical protein